MYKIDTLDYHYYYEIADFLNECLNHGLELVQIIQITASGDPNKMHRAILLMRSVSRDFVKF